jgi:hypothetical protein
MRVALLIKGDASGLDVDTMGGAALALCVDFPFANLPALPDFTPCIPCTKTIIPA